MSFLPQNITDRARAAGQSVADYANKTANNITSSLKTSSNIVTDAVESVVGALPEDVQGAVNFVDGTLKPSTKIDGETIDSYANGPIKNVLGRFASYNYIFTLGPLTKTELANPDATYRKHGPSVVVLRSGGTGNNKVRTSFEKDSNIYTEYFIDNVEVMSLIAPNPATRQTNASTISFEVLEPYSMGMFLQTMQVAAIKAGHENYLQAPFLLTVEFVGWDDNGNYVTIPQTKRMFPLMLSNATFNVTEQGSVYQVSAIPYNEVAFSDEVQMIQTDLDLEGGTLLEMLQTGPNSLASQLNSRELELENSGSKEVGDEYVIIFPKNRNSAEESLTGASEDNSGATTQTSAPADAGGIREMTDKQKQDLFEAFTGLEDGDIPEDFESELDKVLGIIVRRSAIGESIREFAENEENCNSIGMSKIAKSYLDTGKSFFGKPAFVESKDNPGVWKRGNITISAEAKKVQFAQKTKIQDIIEELVLLSEYGRQFITENPDSNGMKKWFRIETQVYIVPDSATVNQTGKPARVFVYRVVPYGVQASRVSAPTEVPPGYKNLKKQALKEYNYIYTGKNDDIINFDIQLNAAFQTAIMADFGQGNADGVTANQDSLAAQNQPPVYGSKQGRTDVKSTTGSSTTAPKTSSQSGGKGGGAQQHPETQLARSFNDAIVNSETDLAKVEMEIWGDPYYIADSGMGNYNASEIAGSMNMTADGAVDYQNSEVDIVINFRTPIDIGKNGFMNFPAAGTQIVGAFSGLYQVTQVRNKFQNGKFTQELTTLRRKNQETDTNGAAPLDNASAVEEKGAAGLLAPVVDQAVGSFIPPGFDPSAASINGMGGILSQGSALSNAVADFTGAANGLSGELSNMQSKINNLTKGKLPTGIADAAKNLTNNVTQSNTTQKVWDDNLGDYI